MQHRQEAFFIVKNPECALEAGPEVRLTQGKGTNARLEWGLGRELPSTRSAGEQAASISPDAERAAWQTCPEENDALGVHNLEGTIWTQGYAKRPALGKRCQRRWLCQFARKAGAPG